MKRKAERKGMFNVSFTIYMYKSFFDLEFNNLLIKLYIFYHVEVEKV